MTTFNEWSQQRFNNANMGLDQGAISKHFDARLARLYTYLDLQVIRRWILPRLLGINEPIILDVGAGKGRMTGHLAEFAAKVVAIEPFQDSYKVLAGRFSSPKIEIHRTTLAQYAQAAIDRFDLIYVRGVVPYSDSNEVVEMLKAMKHLLRPGGFIQIHDYGVEPKTTAEQDGIILRNPGQMKRAFERAGLPCRRWRRAYPPNLIWYVVKTWSNRSTKTLWTAMTAPPIYPFWEFLASLNLPHRRTSYFFYTLTDK